MNICKVVLLGAVRVQIRKRHKAAVYCDSTKHFKLRTAANQPLCVLKCVESKPLLVVCHPWVGLMSSCVEGWLESLWTLAVPDSQVLNPLLYCQETPVFPSRACRLVYHGSCVFFFSYLILIVYKFPSFLPLHFQLCNSEGRVQP